MKDKWHGYVWNEKLRISAVLGFQYSNVVKASFDSTEMFF